MINVRYWAAARELAGTTSEPVSGGTLPDVLAGVAALHGPAMAGLLARCVLLVDGEQVRRDLTTALPDGATVEVLPPYAGGAR